ncbi:hypothetical protein [Psychrobacillus sp. AK 1817]|uniref:hypothetical protein n=1 Tax=Psychrobacillus sp. AK 1817 TaxID=2303505 RepID=UPI001CD93653|nr:hypothetical protein [Psychrobacillus sp. AK 1817]
MKTRYFVQYSSVSMINSFLIPEEPFTSISIGIRDLETDFIFTLVQNMFSFPIFVVLENDIFEQGKNIILERNIPSFKFSSDGFIFKIDSFDTLEAICDITVDLALNACLFSTDKGFLRKIWFHRGNGINLLNLKNSIFKR